MENCIFCKIAEGSIPSIKVYEDEDFLAFQALSQVNKGHCLFIPKKHSNNFLEMEPSLASKMNEKIQTIARAMMKGLKAEGINLITNINEAAGQEIIHTHIHIIPRYSKDGVKMPSLKETDEEERIIFAEKIIKELE